VLLGIVKSLEEGAMYDSEPARNKRKCVKVPSQGGFCDSVSTLSVSGESI